MIHNGVSSGARVAARWWGSSPSHKAGPPVAAPCMYGEIGSLELGVIRHPLSLPVDAVRFFARTGALVLTLTDESEGRGLLSLRLPAHTRAAVEIRWDVVRSRTQESGNGEVGLPPLIGP